MTTNNPADDPTIVQWADCTFVAMQRSKRNHEYHYAVHFIRPTEDFIDGVKFGTDYAAAEKYRRDMLKRPDVRAVRLDSGADERGEYVRVALVKAESVTVFAGERR